MFDMLYCTLPVRSLDTGKKAAAAFSRLQPRGSLEDAGSHRRMTPTLTPTKTMRMTISPVSILLLAGLFAAGRCTGPTSESLPQAGKQKTVMTKDDLFEKLDAVFKLKSLDTEPVQAALGLKLAFKKLSSSSAFDFLEAELPSSSSIEKVEIRRPRDAGRQEMLILTIGKGLGIGVDDITKRFGEKPEMSFPNHHQPADSPVYYSFKIGGQQVSFGLKGKPPGRLSKIIIDRRDAGRDP